MGLGVVGELVRGIIHPNVMAWTVRGGIEHLQHTWTDKELLSL